jgi:microcompartment protein CcmK/EutM
VILARVEGSSWGTMVDPHYVGRAVRVVVPWDGKTAGPAFLAVDPIGARVGDVVLVTRDGNTARDVAGAQDGPVHSAIVGIAIVGIVDAG